MRRTIYTTAAIGMTSGGVKWLEKDALLLATGGLRFCGFKRRLIRKPLQ